MNEREIIYNVSGKKCFYVDTLPTLEKSEITPIFLSERLGRKWRVTNDLLKPFCFKLYTTQSKHQPIEVCSTSPFWKRIMFKKTEYNYNEKDVQRLIQYCIKLNILYLVDEFYSFGHSGSNNFGKSYLINNYNLKSYIEFNKLNVKWTKELTYKVENSETKTELKLSKKEKELWDRFYSIYKEEEKLQTSNFKYFCFGQRPTCEICYDNSVDNLWKHNLTKKEEGVIYREDKLDVIMGKERTLWDVQGSIPNIIRVLNTGKLYLKDRSKNDFHSELAGIKFNSKEERNLHKIMTLTKVFSDKRKLRKLVENFTKPSSTNLGQRVNKDIKNQFLNFCNLSGVDLTTDSPKEVEEKIYTYWDNTIEHFNSIIGKEHYKKTIFLIEGCIMMKLTRKLNECGIMTEHVYDEVICKGKVSTNLIEQLYIESIKECGINITEVER